jgi:hypothetical protein
MRESHYPEQWNISIVRNDMANNLAEDHASDCASGRNKSERGSDLRGRKQFDGQCSQID